MLLDKHIFSLLFLSKIFSGVNDLNVHRCLFLVCGDPEVIHHLPASTMGCRVGTLSSEGGKLVKVTRT